MKLYAERPIRRIGQVLADLLVVAWVAGAVWFADQLHTQVLTLQAPGFRLIDAGARFQKTFQDAAHTAGDVPFVGGDLAGALNRGSDAGHVVAAAGQSQVEAVGYAATGVMLAVLILLIVPMLWFWLPRRVSYARAAGSAAAMRASAPELLALRGLTELPARRLLRLDVDPAAAWRRGDPALSDRLAAMHLARLGLRPARTTVVSGKR